MLLLHEVLLVLCVNHVACNGWCVCFHGCSTLGIKVWYSIYITTADVRGAGTDAEVYMALTGSERSSGKLVLPSRPEHFERGCRDKFR